MSDTAIIPLDDVAFTFADWEWPFAQTHAAEIAAHFAARQKENPSLWNGRVLLANHWSVANGLMRGTFFATDYANFLAWYEGGYPDQAVTNCVAMGVIRTADDAFVLGVMGTHTASAGKIYFPAGAPDPQDVVGEHVDLIGNIAREVAEETGLTDVDFRAEPGWTAMVASRRLALVRVLRAHAAADELQMRIRAYLASEQRPELDDIRIVRSRADFDPMMPKVVIDYLDQALG
jgi:hypothetical protein